MAARHTSRCKQRVEQERRIVGNDVGAAQKATAYVRTGGRATIASVAEIVTVTPPDGQVARKAVANEVASSKRRESRWDCATQLIV